jgi:hypothetical protein
VHPRFLAPWNALHVVYGFTAIASVPAALAVGVTSAFDWWGFSFAWFIAVVYVFANLSNLVFYWRFRRERFHIVWNLLVPLVGIGSQCLVLWQTVIVELWRQGWSGRSAQVLIVFAALATAVYVGYVNHTRTNRIPTSSQSCSSGSRTSP